MTFSLYSARMNKRTWLNELKRAEIRGATEIKINRLMYVGKSERALDELIQELRTKGYSIRDVMLDDDTLLLYRIFLPRGSRMEDKTE